MNLSTLHCAVISLLCLAASAHGAEPADNYRGTLEGYIFYCKLVFGNEQLEAELGEKAAPERLTTSQCISKYKAELKPLYEAAQAALKNPAAKTALKEHYIAGLSALTGIAPESGERKFQYEQRQQGLLGKMRSAWTRFEVER